MMLMFLFHLLYILVFFWHFREFCHVYLYISEVLSILSHFHMQGREQGSKGEWGR